MSRVRTNVAAPLKVVFELDGGAWHVYVPAVPGCRSQGRSLSEARCNLREALALFDREDAELIEDVHLPTSGVVGAGPSNTTAPPMA